MTKIEELRNYVNTSTEISDYIEQIVETKLYNYDILQDYLTRNRPKLGEYEMSNNYTLNYIYHCMLLDKDWNGSCNNSLVYFIRNKANGLLKIGKTNRLSSRMSEIKSAFQFVGFDEQDLVLEAISYCPFGMNNGKVEAYYHKLFTEYRKNGEWFDVPYDVLLENLYFDYIVDNVLVTIECTMDFRQGVKNVKLHEEQGKEYLINFLRENLIQSYCETNHMCNFRHELLEVFGKNKNYISAIDVLSYIIEVDGDLNLDKRIKRKVEEIISNTKQNKRN